VMVNFNSPVSFADQLIERREGSRLPLKSTHTLVPLSNRTYTRTEEPTIAFNFTLIMQTVRSNHEGRGVTIIKMKSKEIVSSATHQDNEGAKPTLTVNSRRSVRLPLTGTVGEEETHVLLEFHCRRVFRRPIDRTERGVQASLEIHLHNGLSLRQDLYSDGGTHVKSEFHNLGASRPTDNEGRGATINILKPISAMSSATHQDSRGAKPTLVVNSRLFVRLPLTGTVGEEETNHRLNPRGGLSFADQEIEGARSITIMNPNYWMTSPSLWTYTRTAETNMLLNFIEEMQAVRSNHTGRGVTICILKSTIGLSSATHEDRGAKPIQALNSKSWLCLPPQITLTKKE